MLEMMLLAFVPNGVELQVDILGGISKDSSRVFVSQQLMTIRSWNRLLSSLQQIMEMIQAFISDRNRTTCSGMEP